MMKRIDVIMERIDVRMERIDVTMEKIDVTMERMDVIMKRIDVMTERVDVNHTWVTDVEFNVSYQPDHMIFVVTFDKQYHQGHVHDIYNELLFECKK